MAEEENLPNSNSKEIRLFRSRGPYTTYSNPTWEIEESRNKGWENPITREKYNVNDTMKDEKMTLEDIQQIYQKCCRDVAFWVGIPDEDLPIDTVRIFIDGKAGSGYNRQERTIDCNLVFLKVYGKQKFTGMLYHEIAHAAVEYFRLRTGEITQRISEWRKTFDGLLLDELLPLAAQAWFVGLKYYDIEFFPELGIHEIKRLIEDLSGVKQGGIYRRNVYSPSVCRFGKWLAKKYGPEKIIQMASGENIGKSIDVATRQVLGKSFGEIILEYASDHTKTYASRELNQKEVEDLNMAIKFISTEA